MRDKQNVFNHSLLFWLKNFLSQRCVRIAAVHEKLLYYCSLTGLGLIFNMGFVFTFFFYCMHICHMLFFTTQCNTVIAGVPLYDCPPEKSLPADNLPVKIRPARRLPGRGGFLPVYCRRGTFLGSPKMVRLCYRAGDILIRETYRFRDYLFPGGFFTGETF